MGFYVLMTVSTMIPAIFLNKFIGLKNLTSKQRFIKAVLIVLTFLPMYATNAFMFETGNDYVNYQYAFDSVYRLGLTNRFEKGYVFVNKLLIALNLDFQWVYITLCLVGYGSLFAFMLKNSKNIALSLGLYIASGYFFLLGLNALRAFIAIAIYLFSYRYIIKKKFFPFLCLSLLAGTFHMIAFLMIPFYFILNHNFKLSTFFTAGALALIAAPINKLLMSLVVKGEFYSVYVAGPYNSSGFFFDVVFNLGFFLCVAIVFWYHKNGYKDKKDNIFSNSAIISLAIAILIPWFPEYKRFMYFLMIPFFSYLPEILEREPNKLRRYVITTVLILSFTLSTVTKWHAWGVVPYQSIFSILAK